MNRTKTARKTRVRKIRILVVDDHPIVYDGLATLIHQEDDMMVCAKTRNGTDTIRAVRQHRIDFAIVDVLLKNITGFEVAKKIQLLHPEIQVLMFSMSDDPWYVKQAFLAGAKGYITKDELSETVIDGIRHILKGGFYLSPRLSRRFSKRQREELFANNSTESR
jgi:DNA-binding NarL/FixJ family response regulator